MAGTRAGDKELPEKSRDVKEDGGFYDEVMSAHSKGKDGKGKYRGKGHDGFPEQGKGNHYGWHKGHDHDDSYGG
ncbi:hypothetical protein GCM10011371_24360 [Novosphingobium marinum]|uniref:Uncharacterized protein n=1 Tax=Novosphingobium marinum TaxID=1514948 RepID=A0A7Y9XY28_9SPHN|nr:hypothetical protein [Novosphingobium marinum]NYH96550.1 hypothetical protein [Novosphingobium marinum]GGC36107.1 hypothetical protein GCM10011371_24360 [Novosphingobium marinum]